MADIILVSCLKAELRVNLTAYVQSAVTEIPTEVTEAGSPQAQDFRWRFVLQGTTVTLEGDRFVILANYAGDIETKSALFGFHLNPVYPIARIEFGLHADRVNNNAVITPANISCTVTLGPGSDLNASILKIPVWLFTSNILSTGTFVGIARAALSKQKLEIPIFSLADAGWRAVAFGLAQNSAISFEEITLLAYRLQRVSGTIDDLVMPVKFFARIALQFRIDGTFFETDPDDFKTELQNLPPDGPEPDDDTHLHVTAKISLRPLYESLYGISDQDVDLAGIKFNISYSEATIGEDITNGHFDPPKEFLAKFTFELNGDIDEDMVVEAVPAFDKSGYRVYLTKVRLADDSRTRLAAYGNEIVQFMENLLASFEKDVSLDAKPIVEDFEKKLSGKFSYGMGGTSSVGSAVLGIDSELRVGPVLDVYLYNRSLVFGFLLSGPLGAHMLGPDELPLYDNDILKAWGGMGLLGPKGSNFGLSSSVVPSGSLSSQLHWSPGLGGVFPP